jgi:UDP-glucose 4-epimerase
VRILVLGHLGFIGRYVTSACGHAMPAAEVIGRSLQDVDLAKAGQAESLADIVDAETTIVVCAAVKRQLGDNLAAFAQNIDIAKNLCVLFERRQARRIVYFSSAAVYGEDVHNTAIKEDTPVQPRTYYGIAKYTSECLLKKVVEAQDGTSLLLIRPPLVYGPGDLSESYGPVGFLLKAMRGEPIVLWGDGTEKRDFVYAEDVGRIVAKLVAGSDSGVVNLAGGESHTFKDILDVIAELLPNDIDISSRERSKAKVDNVFCNDRLMKMTDDFAFTPLREGIEKTMHHFDSIGR